MVVVYNTMTFVVATETRGKMVGTTFVGGNEVRVLGILLPNSNPVFAKNFSLYCGTVGSTINQLQLS
jgi:hypothetical protein